jgi:chemotaxis protein MotB
VPPLTPAERARRAKLAAAHKPAGGGGGGRWLVSYADFVTLMFGFFLILWASADPDPQKFELLAKGFQTALNSGAMLGQAGTGQVLGQGGRSAPIQVSSFQRVSEEAGELAAQANLQDQVSVGLRREGLAISLSSNLLFEPGGVTLRPEAGPFLSRLATSIEPGTDRVRIEGHTDDVSPAPGYPSNWELSNLRAAAVLRYFTETLGMPGDRFELAGFAQYHPLAPNDTRENRSKNRRVEIVLLKPTGEGVTAP